MRSHTSLEFGPKYAYGKISILGKISFNGYTLHFEGYGFLTYGEVELSLRWIDFLILLTESF